MSNSITVEFFDDERNFILDLIAYTLQDDVLDKFKNAKPNKKGILKISLGLYDIEDLIGNLSFEANHNEKPSIQKKACDVADMLEIYELQLKKETV